MADPSYAFRVFLIQKPANHEKSADAAVEFVKYDSANPEEMKKYEHLITLIKDKSVPLDTTIKITKDTNVENNRVVLVDRGGAKGVPTVGITRDPSKSDGVLVIEKLSDLIFDDVYGIVDASLILHNRFGEIPLSPRSLCFVYAGREKVTQEGAAEILLRSSYDHYLPFLYWMLNCGSEGLKTFLTGTLTAMTHPKIYSLLKLFVACDHDGWLTHVKTMSEGLKKLSQKPPWYWAFEKWIKQSGERSGIYTALELKPTDKLVDVYVKDLLSEAELAKGILSEACANYATTTAGDKGILRKLDLIAHFQELKSKLPEPPAKQTRVYRVKASSTLAEDTAK